MRPTIAVTALDLLEIGGGEITPGVVLTFGRVEDGDHCLGEHRGQSADKPADRAEDRARSTLTPLAVTRRRKDSIAPGSVVRASSDPFDTVAHPREHDPGLTIPLHLRRRSHLGPSQVSNRLRFLLRYHNRSPICLLCMLRAMHSGAIICSAALRCRKEESADAGRSDSRAIEPHAACAGEPVPLKEGWRGRFYEDFTVGDIYRHPLGRTVIAADNVWFTLLTQNTAPIHFDRHYAAQTEFGKPLVDSTFTLALVTGQSVTDVSQNVLANLGWDEVRLPHPVFEGDTIYSQSEVLAARESQSRQNVGIVTVRTTGYNQDGTVVITFTRTFMVYKRGQAPAPPEPARRSPQ
jgi:itaconyl-CoA hydratase